MKTLYPKGKGKIHPSPSCATGGGAGEAVTVLNLLPAAILALTAALGAEDKEVLAYLVTRSLQGPCSVGHHQALFDCGCFDCYTSYWFRWDSSPDRELIHQAIEAFEEHLASSEQRHAGGKGGRRRDRRFSDRSDKPNGRRKPGKVKEDEKPPSEEGGPSHGHARSSLLTEEREEAEVFSGEVVPGAELGLGTELEDEGDSSIDAAALSQPLGSEKRRPWMDVMGLFGSRFWNLWCPSP
ncbi:unnamed protein product [Spirodela intermedia]|uniref:Uncharacterized protein n=1 Tax=Spirodela intermedia TaxID=51605 RepID=A0A7I8IPW0_SPIIN|nr:unnamed protein product [Spirodela intermedia]CAA6659938.1 unnamed protein product [Spirodela intermedia]